MPTTPQALLNEALELSSEDRAALVADLLASLQPTDPGIDQAWVEEATERLAAYRAGQTSSVDARDVFAALGKDL